MAVSYHITVVYRQEEINKAIVKGEPSEAENVITEHVNRVCSSGQVKICRLLAYERFFDDWVDINFDSDELMTNKKLKVIVDSGLNVCSRIKAGSGVNINNGVKVDSGVTVDSRKTADSEVIVDSREIADSGVKVDRGVPVERGVTVDRGEIPDSRANVDSGIVTDSGVIVDSEVTLERREAADNGVIVDSGEQKDRDERQVEQADSNDDELPSASVDHEPVTASQSSFMLARHWALFSPIPDDLPGDVMLRLKMKEMLEPAERKHFLTAVYNHITKYTLYPTPTQYGVIIESIFKKWPHLMDEEGLQIGDVKNLWKKRLRHKFVNSRRRGDRDLEEVRKKRLNDRIHRKRKANHDPETKEQAEGDQYSGVYWLPNYHPERSCGEDDASIKKHIQWMKDHHEEQPKTPDFKQIESLMERTFGDRRRMILVNRMSVSAVMEEFPWLADQDEMLAEYERVTGDDLLQLLNDFVVNNGKAVTRLVKESSVKKPPNLERVLEEYRNNNVQVEQDGTMTLLTFLGLFFLLKEDVESCISNVMDTTLPVQILYDKDLCTCDRFTVFVESTEICRSKTFSEAMSVYIACFYVFNLMFPGKLIKFLIFIEKCILGLNDRVWQKKSRKVKDLQSTVVALIARLNSSKNRLITVL